MDDVRARGGFGGLAKEDMAQGFLTPGAGGGSLFTSWNCLCPSVNAGHGSPMRKQEMVSYVCVG